MTRPKRETASSSQADAPSARRSRRQAIALAGAAAAAATVAALGMEGAKKAQAQAGAPLLLGQENNAREFSTGLAAAVDDGDALHVSNEGNGGAAGLVGNCRSGVGVRGHTSSGVGVRAECTDAADGDDGPKLALDVIGRARFSTAGAGVVRAREDAATVENRAVAADSHVTLTFTGDPDRASVAWVERLPDRGFAVHLTKRPRWKVGFTYFIVGASM